MLTCTAPVRPEDHFRLVGHCLKRYRASARAIGMDPADLEQEGHIGLLRACQDYDPARGPFGPFAAFHVRRQMCRALTRYKRMRQLPETFGPEAAAEPVGRERPDPDAPLDVPGLLARLPGRERRAVELRYGIGDGVERSLEEVAGELGISRQRAHQVLRRAMRRMVGPGACR